jgi:hypothetical protein
MGDQRPSNPNPARRIALLAARCFIAREQQRSPGAAPSRKMTQKIVDDTNVIRCKMLAASVLFCKKTCREEEP